MNREIPHPPTAHPTQPVHDCILMLAPERRGGTPRSRGRAEWIVGRCRMKPAFRPALLVALLFAVLMTHSGSAQNRVLELDGNGSYVELPPNIFQNLTEATVECWARWDRFNNYSRVFEFGAIWNSMSVFNHGRNPDLRFNLYPTKALGRPSLTYHARANGVLRSNEWIHIAVVSGPGGMKLYADGVVVATHTNEACLIHIKAEQLNLIGRGLSRNPDDQDFCGQLDEVRVWNHRRTAEQIRENMNRRVSGREGGLVGLWNFDDGLATDSSFRANHGKLVGNARVVTPGMPAGLQLTAAEPAAPPPQPERVPTVVQAAPTAAVAVPEAGRNVLYWWIAGALTLIAVLLAWLVVMLKRGGGGNPTRAVAELAAPGSVGAIQGSAGTGSSDVKERALAELTEFARLSLVQGLYSQRNALLETQQQAHREMAEMEARLAALKISDRVLAYEKRISELERELAERTGEVRELTSATLALLRSKVEEERELERRTQSRRFN